MSARTLCGTGVAAVAAAAAWSAPAAAPVVPAICTAFGIARRLEGPGIALTFDDGPHAHGTPAVLAELARYGVRATFFVVGEQVERDPALAAEIVAAGHEVALHGYAHTLLLRRGPRALAHDLDRANAIVESATGTSPTCYRPPYGVFSTIGLALCKRRGWRPMLWSRWGRDWGARESPVAIARRAAASAVAGDVVLLHDADHYSSPGSWRRTAAALPAILESLLATGAPLVAVSADGPQAAEDPLPFVTQET
jgi:peptidoglycan/xylan/chitin deacetylase (PgdA/CDA1 family)